MSRPLLAAGLAVLTLLLLPGAVAAQAPCPEPSVDAFLHSRAGGEDRSGAAETPYELSVQISGADRVEVSWGDGSTGAAAAPDGSADIAHAFATAGRYAVDVVAVGTCEGRPVRSAPGRLTVDIGPACRVRRGRSLGAALCDDARGALRIGAGRSSTRGNWLSAPCRDSGGTEEIPPERPPTATAAACASNPQPPPVPGAVRARRGGLLTLRLGAPAGRVTVRAGTRDGPTVRLGRARRADAAGRTFRVRLRRVPRTATRLFVRARGQSWVAGLRLRR